MRLRSQRTCCSSFLSFPRVSLSPSRCWCLSDSAAFARFSLLADRPIAALTVRCPPVGAASSHPPLPPVRCRALLSPAAAHCSGRAAAARVDDDDADCRTAAAAHRLSLLCSLPLLLPLSLRLQWMTITNSRVVLPPMAPPLTASRSSC
jgi:hypothetical protein